MELFGEDILGRTDPEWGLDEEGEINGSYKPCGYPGVSLVAPAVLRASGHADAVVCTAVVRHRRLLHRTDPLEAARA